MIRYWKDVIGRWIISESDTVYLVFKYRYKDRSGWRGYELIKIDADRKYKPHWYNFYSLGRLRAYDFHVPTHTELRIVVKLAFSRGQE